jgi:hypothetical protein
MADNVISVAVNFVENHRYTFPAADPTTWTPVTDPVRGPPKDKFIYIFMSVANGPFQLLKACRTLPSGELLEVTASAALQGNFGSGQLGETSTLPTGTPQSNTRVPDTIQQALIRYVFYVSRHILDGSFIVKLAASPPPELTVLTLDTFKASPVTIGITDPLTIAEQLSIDYEKARRAYVSLCAPFDEQSSQQKKATSDLLKKIAIAQIFTELDRNVNATPLSGFAQQPDTFLTQQTQLRATADGNRDQAAMECILWLNGPLMDFVRTTYGADASANSWTGDISELIKVEGAVIARIADSYRGACHIRTLIGANHYIMRELMGRPGGVQPSSFTKVKDAALDVWDVVTKLWIAVAAIMAALEARSGPRAVAVNSTFTIARMVTSYNTVFGAGLVTQTTQTNATSFQWRDSITGQTQNVLLNGPLDSLVVVTSDNRFVLLQKAQSSPNSTFTSTEFAKGIALVNLALAVSAAYDALLRTNTPQTTTDNFFTATKLISGIVNTASFFPQELATLLKLTGRGVSYVSLAGAALSIATSFGDTANTFNNGDFDSAFGSALVTAGGVLFFVGAIITVANGGIVIGAAATLGAVALVVIVVGSAIALLAKDNDMDLMTGHSFLGNRFGKDSNQPSWSQVPLQAWSDPTSGLDHQLSALFNLVFAFLVNETLSLTATAHNVLVVDYGAYPAGATFQININGAIQKLAGGAPQAFNVNLVIDPADQTVSSGAGALASGSVQISSGKIIVDAVPSAFNPLAESLNGVTWSVLMSVALNPLHSVTSGVVLSQGFVTPLPATIPTSGNPVQVSGLSNAASTEIS